MAVLLPGAIQIASAAIKNLNEDIENSKSDFEQENPVNSGYSPRLFGAPPQLSNLCDMRILSAKDGLAGAVGDYYLEDVLKNAQVANFSVGRALFTGGFNSIISMGLNLASYAYAYSKYGLAGKNQEDTPATSVQADVMREQSIAFSERAKALENSMNSNAANSEEELAAQEQLNSLLGYDSTPTEVTSMPDGTTVLTDASTLINNQDLLNAAASGAGVTRNNDTQFSREEIQTTETVMNQVDETTGEVLPEEIISIGTATLADIEASLGEDFRGMSLTGLEDSGSLIDVSSISELLDLVKTISSGIGTGLRNGAATLGASLLSSVMVQQPFYTFEPDWKTYINNVKMMINAAIVMLGLQSAYVRIGNTFHAICDDPNYVGDFDIWTMYRYITPTENTGVATSIDTLNGESTQYISFMIDPSQEGESYQNDVGPSDIYSSVINKGSSIGAEIAFITSSSQSVIDDAVISLAGSSIDAAQKILGSLGGGIGKFTASVAAGMAKTFTGDHTIYPEIFKSHTSHQSFSVHVKLRASRGDPYTYLMDVLVPLFHIMGMVLPKMSKNSAAAYQYPPLVQCNVPGIWGTRLGIVESVTVTKNPDGDSLSVNGFPMSVNVDINVKDLMHTLVTTPMDSPALFLNNYTMFDYIAQCTGVDKFRVNSAARIITKIALAASYADSIAYNIGESVITDITSRANKVFIASRY